MIPGPGGKLIERAVFRGQVLNDSEADPWSQDTGRTPCFRTYLLQNSSTLYELRAKGQPRSSGRCQLESPKNGASEIGTVENNIPQISILKERPLSAV